MPRKDERFAKISFERFLELRGPSEQAAWSDGTEPPDYFLTVGERRYAVEVTRIVRRIALDGRVLSTRTLGASLVRFAETLEAEALSRGILHGAYVVWLEPVPDFEDVAPDLREKFFNYIERTRTLESAPEEIVLRRPDVHWSIQKSHDGRTYLAPTYSEEPGGSLLSETIQDFPALLADSVRAKRRKLSQLNLPTVLLLVDDYHYAPSSLWKESVPADAAEGFHTIARTYREYECQVLFSQRDEWCP